MPKNHRIGGFMKQRIFLGLILFLFLFFGCQTRVTYTRLKPSEINMSHYRNIIVFFLDETSSQNSIYSFFESVFEHSDYRSSKSLHSVIPRFAWDYLSQELANSQYFNILSQHQISDFLTTLNQENLTEVELGALLGVDAVIIGRIINMKWEDNYFKESKTSYDSEGNKTVVDVPMIKREFSLSLNYQIIDTGTNRIIAGRSFDRKSSDIKKSEDRVYLKDPEDVFKSMITTSISRFVRQVAPYSIVESCLLIRDKSKNPQLVVADSFAKDRLYAESLEIFLDVWKKTRNIVAGYNASVLLETIGMLDEALELLDEVLTFYPEKTVIERKKHLVYIIKETQKVEQQLN